MFLIKEKRMSLSHWRYRLLHWTFGKNPKTPEESDLPKFLYTHYCPLFHVTNLLVVLLPLILFTTFFYRVAKHLYSLYELFIKEKVKETVIEESLVLTYLMKYVSRYDYSVKNENIEVLYDFDRFLICFASSLQKPVESLENIGDFKRDWEKYSTIIKNSREIKREEYLARQEKMIKLTNFSRTLYRVLFAAMVVFALLVVLFSFVMISSFIFSKIFQYGILKVLFEIVKISLFGLLVVTPVILVGVGMDKYQVHYWFREKITKMLSTSNAFLKGFYEENCPPIKIVTPEEEKIENSLN